MIQTTIYDHGIEDTVPSTLKRASDIVAEWNKRLPLDYVEEITGQLEIDIKEGTYDQLLAAAHVLSFVSIDEYAGAARVYFNLIKEKHEPKN